MTRTSGRLKDYPGLALWLETSGYGLDLSAAEIFVRKTCYALQSPDIQLVAHSAEALLDLVTETDDPFGAFLKVRSIADSCDVDLLQFIGDICVIAVKSGRADLYRQALSIAADRTDISALRFLSAWIALNEGDLSLCVEECAKIKEPEASVQTMMGQALLELGRVPEAINILTTAIKIAPRELLAWFQLAKAYYAIEQLKASWGALLTCNKLAPASEEIAVFMAMVALKTGDTVKLDLAHAILDEHRETYRDNPIIVLNLLKLALAKGDKEDARRIVESGQWDKICFEPEFMREIGSILKTIERLRWMDVGRDLLIKVTPDVA